MKLTFIRHGETESNKNDIHQHEGVPLSQKGVDQAEVLSKRIKAEDFDLLISSPYVRARQTAEVLARQLNKEIVFDARLGEMKNPDEIVGKKFVDPTTFETKRIILENENDPSFHYSNEENVFDFVGRVRDFVGGVEDLKASNPLIVSHGKVIKTLVYLMLLEESIDPTKFRKFLKHLSTDNCSITQFEVKEGVWKLITWNDTIHFDVVQG